MLLVHGTWCNGDSWNDFAEALRHRGFRVHAPSLRHHSAPVAGAIVDADKVGKVGLLEFVSDLVDLVSAMSCPPIVIGHSLGALYAQLLAARVTTAGVVLLGPAPAPGIFAMYPSSIRLWARYIPQWLAGKPMYPVSWKIWTELICNAQPPQIQQSYYDSLCAESGTVYRQMSLWFLDPARAARVDYSAVQVPVLVVAGSEDKCTVPQIGRATAAKYGERATYVEVAGSDHLMTVGQHMPQTVRTVEEWINSHIPDRA
ncbi:alpha/beta hydrolase [Nocardia nova]|uniref:alpha/beta hydrolase n=1 Tax=Nocardia nova TaxID=37330 RepID=UPI0033F6C2C5